MALLNNCGNNGNFFSDSLQWVTLISQKYSVSLRLCVPIKCETKHTPNLTKSSRTPLSTRVSAGEVLSKHLTNISPLIDSLCAL